jgi:UDP:flavonoid glycosyltransferase YjiC (YdhE family)
MATLLLATIPIPAHTRNAAPFASRLAEAGHDVLWYAGRGFHDDVRATGATPLAPDPACDLTVGGAGPVRRAVVGRGNVLGVRRAYLRVFVGQAPQRARDIGAVLAARPVDAVVTDGLSYGVGLAAERAGVPWATFGDGPLAFPDEDTPPFGSGLLPMPGPSGQRRNKIVAAAVNLLFARPERRYQQVRSELGLSPSAGGIFADNLSPYLHLHGATPGFEYPRRNLPPHVHWVGPFRPDPPLDWAPPPWWPHVTRSRRPVVLVSQGTMRDDIGELIVPALRALEGVDVTVVVTTGSARPEAVIEAMQGAVPRNAVLARYVPYDLLLPHVDVFVTNGGYTGVTLALAHGVPMVQAGATEEKADIGARIAWSGTGIRLLPTPPSPAEVRAAVLRVLADPAYRDAAGRLRDEMAQHDAGRDGASLLLQLADTGRPVLRAQPVA